MPKIKTIDTVDKINKKVVLKGWVHVRRNMGKIVFLDLRDRWGIVQVVCVPQELDKDSEKILKDIRPEFVLSIEGLVQKRGDKQINRDLATGTVEILAKKIQILSVAETPPFEIVNEERKASEELRLKYRYLDLRHERMKQNLLVRDRVISFLRNWLQQNDFVEVQTPILSKSTPEGARDYLVPSRLHKGKFFALPQAPQQYKQLLMIAGLEKYFQIAPCFRDEDARADRSPGEFYQLDMEMSFMTQDEILGLTEKLFTDLIKKEFPQKKITKSPWPRLNYDDVIRKYKTDKPDLRKDKNNKDELAFAWIINFPLFVRQTEEDKFHGAGQTWAPSHNMFTAPQEEDIALLDKDPGKVKSYQHDLVLNGFELGGGAVRISDMKIQGKIWDLIGFTKKQKQEFQHYLEAFKYGVPPHGGIAPGIERLIMILQGEKNLREITAFPLTSDGRDPMMDSPSAVVKEQLDELGLKIL
ncbi:MAG: aspartate--tRNA ligase [Candidatus Komeilibacteria bacterium CG11_big_fil_rev_8_21_14_0_20_36_20]|uniref:Aspartate--tRNA ligase n=1 Tax=Candidatus Komeilibacteria bacterium CG11_big_fil_rev_8_21_14_0_20_36_20 TaxID=1974477 RepID=A0A2H0NB19_9BACT|nr:MAG: aspartate--tRNA ligase [Candidatus Komeilibacteria bacterium CG11_big_fil_rev_8_21_14_0_20_36_20]PIR82095.1 MAG: aspartate--tRNA ligase [Candidatus Komeilibacteria bacterium CG10_big_fil_rev_8_21_14_0_10_36_65]PJC55704.1 MAG: aspartate--tRNA ligase [Candidatus Komeilibacteria bacterium CG_4_9_14_0_2_um_filter_36_13]